MSDSDSGFGDDDDELFLGLLRATLTKPQDSVEARPSPDAQPNHAHGASAKISAANDSALLRAQGEVSILRAQLEAAQSAKNEEVQTLHNKMSAMQNSSRDHISALKQTVDKLEDEKKFLANEVRSLSGTKRRKYPGSSQASTLTGSAEIDAGSPLKYPRETKTTEAKTMVPNKPMIMASPPKYLVPDDWSQLCLHIWRYTINGGSASSMDFLSRICLEEKLIVRSIDYEIDEKIPLLQALWAVLLGMRQMRLDMAVARFCHVIFEMVTVLMQRACYTGVPFLISVVYGCINFKTSALTRDLAVEIVLQASAYLQQLVHVLQGEQEFGDTNVPVQTRLLQHATLLFCFDLLENTVVICTQFGRSFISGMWEQGHLRLDLMKQILPENTERFVSSAQINLVYNFIEVFSASMSEGGVYGEFFNNTSSDGLIIKSLIKVLLIDIPTKSDFSFYGLNRMIGNNHDFALLEQAIPKNPPQCFGSGLVMLPFPIRRPEASESEHVHMLMAHEMHLITLRLHIVRHLECVVVSGGLELLKLKENIKSLVRIIGFEQNLVIHQPRDSKVYMRVEIIGGLIRILFYIIEEHNNINDLIFPETLYEILVILMRIAFSSDSLLLQAHALLSEIRKKGITNAGVFNRECELRSRDVAHFNLYAARENKYAELANIEGDFANGLEFPYDGETVEMSREILAVCVNHDEADNLYYNMTRSQ